MANVVTMDDRHARATKLASELRDGLARVTIPLSDSQHHALRDIVCDYVIELRSLEWPPEQVIKTVKQMAHDVGLASSLKRDALPTDWTDTDRFLSDLMSWSITQYYDG